MKKNKWKRILALGLAVTMTTSCLAGCTKKGGEQGQKGSDFPAVTPETAKQYVYRYNDIALGERSDYSVANVQRIDDKIEVLTQAYTYDEYGETQTITLYTMNLDGSNVTSKQMKTRQNESDFMNYGDTEPVPFDDEETETQSMEILPEEPEDGGDADYDDYEGDWSYEQEDYSWDYYYYQNAIVTKDAVYSILNHSTESHENGEYTSQNDYSVVCWDKDGNERFTSPIDMSQYQNDDTYVYISKLYALKDGQVGIFVGGDVYGMFMIDKDGNISKLKQFGGTDIFNSDPSIMVKEDGTFIVAYYSEDWSKMYMTTYDPETSQAGQEYEVPQSLRNLGLYEFYPGKGSDIIFSGNDGVYTYNLGDAEAKKIMDYINSDLATYEVSNIVSLSDTQFVATYYDDTTYETLLSIFTYIKPEDIQDKKVLVYAGIYIDSNVRRMIINFNKKETDYRITVRDYCIYNTQDDYNASINKLNNDLIAGNIPDIIEVNSSMPIDSYVAKGMLADIDQMIKDDSELSQIEYLDNVFEAYRQNGKLYTVIPRFVIRTWIAKRSLVGDRYSWTMQDVNQYKDMLTGEKSIFGLGMTRESFMNTIMTYGGSDFIDMDSGKCSFDSQNFIDLLEYAKTLPTDDQQYSDYDEDYWQNYWETYQSQYRENRALMLDLYISDVYNIKYSSLGMLGEYPAYVGFPTQSGKGSVVWPENMFAMSAKSANKDGAWKFLRTFLTEDYQKNEDNKYGYSYQLPVIKKYIRDSINELTKRPYWTDMNGEKVEYDDTYYINGQEVILEPFSQAEADKLFDFICSVNAPAFDNADVMKIVTEETDAFFAGSNSAQGTAANIQNRVQLYVNENR
ncbi:MAG: extracellular solute-binding protein [Lachnospiraceae bacterium]|nr:extracellular solute-binding protein [Lachnospiraceae bacterium]